MEKKLSFRKYEKKIMPQFREKMNKAESTEDVKKFFTQTVEELLNHILDRAVKFQDNDVLLLPDVKPYYQISERLQTVEPLKSYWIDSDLPHIISRLADSACGRYRHLEKHPEKTESKIRM